MKIYITIFIVLILVIGGVFSYILSKSLGFEKTEVVWDHYLSSDTNGNGTIYILADRFHKSFIGADAAKEYLKKEHPVWSFPDNSNAPGKDIELYLIKYDIASGNYEYHLLKKNFYAYDGTIKLHGSELYVFWVQQEKRVTDYSWQGDFYIKYGKLDGNYSLDYLGDLDRMPAHLNPKPGDISFSTGAFIHTVEFFPGTSTILVGGGYTFFLINGTTHTKITDYNVTSFWMDENGHVHFLNRGKTDQYYEVGPDLKLISNYTITLDGNYTGEPIELNGEEYFYFHTANPRSETFTFQFYCVPLLNGPMNISGKNNTPFDTLHLNQTEQRSYFEVRSYDDKLVIVKSPSPYTSTEKTKSFWVYASSKDFALIKNGTLQFDDKIDIVLISVHGKGNDMVFLIQEYRWKLDGSPSAINFQRISL
jgi:hypothetical protein